MLEFYVLTLRDNVQNSNQFKDRYLLGLKKCTL